MSEIRSLLKNSNDPEFLKEASMLILDRNEKLESELNEYKRLKKKDDEQKAFELAEFKKLVKQIHKNQFKKGREKLGCYEGLRKEEGLLFHAKSLVDEKKKSERWSVPSEEVKITSDDKTIFELAKKRDPFLEKGFCKIEEIEGFRESSTELTIVERSYKKTIYNRQKYKVTNKKTSEEWIITAPGKMKLLPQCRYSLDFSVAVVVDKYLNHLPYERQRKYMKKKGLDIEVKTLSRLSEMVGLHCDQINPKILGEIKSQRDLAVHVDETPWPILSKKDSNGYMWVLSNQAGSYYAFEPTRSGDVPKALFKDYKGSVLSDGYKGYLFFRKLENINWGCCWAHLRRKFYDLSEDEPEDAKVILDLIGKVFEIERRAKSFEELKLLRQKESKDIVGEIETWLYETRPKYFGESKMLKAINYGLNYIKEFKAFLTDVSLPLTNNDAERALRHSVLGRKNFNGSKTINGADKAASLYTVIESCKKAELDPSDYLKYLIKQNNLEKEALTPLQLAIKQNQEKN